MVPTTSMVSWSFRIFKKERLLNQIPSILFSLEESEKINFKWFSPTILAGLSRRNPLKRKTGFGLPIPNVPFALKFYKF